MRKVLIVYGSVGLGHKVVAENIAAVLRQRMDLKVFMLDILELYRGPFTDESAKIYEFIIKHLPALWGFFYTNRVFQKLTLPLRVSFAGLNSQKFNEYVAKVKPDLIVTTHPTATALTINLKRQGKFHGPIITTFSDFHFQPYWVYAEVDKYLVMTSEQKTEVVRRGFAPQQVVVTGLPVDPIFSKNFDSDEIFREFGMKKDLPIVLVMGGSRGWGVKLSDIKALLEADLSAQLIVITGINPSLEARLEGLAKIARQPFKVFGSWSNEEVAKIFSVSSILITKPGGLTLGQALLKNLPIVLVNPLPTMEELNRDYFLSHKAALRARNPKELVACIQKLLKDKAFYENLQMNMKKISNPQASQKAVAAIIDSLEAED